MFLFFDKIIKGMNDHGFGGGFPQDKEGGSSRVGNAYIVQAFGSFGLAVDAGNGGEPRATDSTGAER